MDLKTYLQSTMKEGETYNARYTRFADKLGVSLYAVRKWLSGERGISDAMKREIVKRTSRTVKLKDLVRR